MQVTDAAGNLTKLTYDGLGRKIAMQDPDMGTWSYEYDALGLLVAQTDARLQRTEFAYDQLKRLVRTWHWPAWPLESVSAGVTKCSVYDLIELRCAVDTDRKAAGLAAFAWTDPALVAGTGVPVRAVHFTELRTALQGLWTAVTQGTLPEFTAGAIVAGTRVIKTSDLEDLRNWLTQYEQSGWAQTRRARVYQEFGASDPPNGLYGKAAARRCGTAAGAPFSPGTQPAGWPKNCAGWTAPAM